MSFGRCEPLTLGGRTAEGFFDETGVFCVWEILAAGGFEEAVLVRSAGLVCRGTSLGHTKVAFLHSSK